MSDIDKENQSPNTFHATELFLCDLADAETPEEMLRSLTTASHQFNHSDILKHDLEVKDGVARALVRTLTTSLQVSNDNGIQVFRETISHKRALRISILCTALERVLQCSGKVLASYLEDLTSQGLVKSLVQIVHLFLPVTTASFMVRDAALSNTARILYLVSKHALDFPKEVVSAVKSLMVCADVPSDARIDTACAVASLIAHVQNTKFSPARKELIMTAPFVISTLTTAVESVHMDQLPDVSRAILLIARKSRTCLLRISSRRDTVFNIVQLMQGNATQSDALNVTAMLLNCEATAKKLWTSNPALGVIVLQGLAKVARMYHIKDQNKDLAIAILMSVLDSENFMFHHKRIVNDALIGVAYVEPNILLRTEVAFGLCRQLLKKPDKVDEEAKILYPTIIDFLTFPMDAVRMEALFTLDVCTWSKEVAVVLMAEYAFVDNLAGIIDASNPSRREEQDAAFSVLHNCSKDEVGAEFICLNTTLLVAIVEYTVRQDINKQSILEMKFLEILLNIFAKRSNRVHFKEFTELLPWLATAASITDSDDLKKKLVKAIIQLSRVYLEAGIPNRFMV